MSHQCCVVSRPRPVGGARVAYGDVKYKYRIQPPGWLPSNVSKALIENAAAVQAMVSGAIGLAPPPISSIGSAVIDKVFDFIWEEVSLEDQMQELYVRIETLLKAMRREDTAREVKRDIKAFSDQYTQYAENRHFMDASVMPGFEPKERDRMYAMSVIPKLLERIANVRASITVILASPEFVDVHAVSDYMMITAMQILLMQDMAMFTTERTHGSTGEFLKPWQTHAAVSIQAAACIAVDDLDEMQEALWNARKRHIKRRKFTSKFSRKTLHYVLDDHEGVATAVYASEADRSAWYNDGSFPWGFAPKGWYWLSEADMVASRTVADYFCSVQSSLWLDLGFPGDKLRPQWERLRHYPLPYPIMCNRWSGVQQCAGVPVHSLPRTIVPPFSPGYPSIQIQKARGGGYMLSQRGGISVFTQDIRLLGYTQYSLKLSELDDWVVTVAPRTRVEYGGQSLVLMAINRHRGNLRVMHGDQTIVPATTVKPDQYVYFIIDPPTTIGIPALSVAAIDRNTSSATPMLYLYDKAPVAASTMVLRVKTSGENLVDSATGDWVSFWDPKQWSFASRSNANPGGQVPIAAVATSELGSHYLRNGHTARAPKGTRLALMAGTVDLVYPVKYADADCKMYGANSTGSYTMAFIDSYPRPYTNPDKGNYVCYDGHTWSDAVDDMPSVRPVKDCPLTDGISCTPTWE